MKSDVVDVSVQKLAETEMAVLVTDTTADQGVWLPKSQIEIERSATPGIYTVTLPERLALKTGLI